MDSKNKNRSIIGIVIITLVFGILAITSVIKMYSGIEEEEKLNKTSYILMLEKELQMEFNSEDDFVNFASIPNDVVVEPTKYQYYYKPCFDFVIVKDGVVITNRLSKEFDSFGFMVGMKITKINDEVLLGKSYFEIVELLYSKTVDEVKKFTTSDNQELSYTYKNYYSSYEYNEEQNTLYVYNLDNITSKAIYEVVDEHDGITLDLSKATVTTFDGVYNFLSLFSDKEEILFKTPENIIGLTKRKINSLNIVVKDNKDKGILFTLTALKTINSNITIDKTDLSTTTFYAVKTIKSSEYNIYIKKYLLEAKSANNSGGTTV